MSLNIKTIIVILAATLLLLGTIFGYSEITFSKSYAALETNDVNQNVARANSAYDNILDDLNRLNHDWSAWDDTYSFVQKPTQAYIDSNPTDITFINAKLNFLLIINNSGDIIYSKGFNLDQQQEVPISPNIKEQFTNQAVLYHADINSSTSGVILDSGLPIMFSAQPILTSENKGPITGTIIMARYINDGVLDNLKSTTHLPITFIYNLSSSDDKAPDILTASTNLTKDQPVFIQPLSEKTIAGYRLINDIYGNPAFIMKTELPRSSYIQGAVDIKSLSGFYCCFRGYFCSSYDDINEPSGHPQIEIPEKKCQPDPYHEEFWRSCTDNR